MPDLSLIAGLGNPGSEYARTRHNAGFMAVDELALRWRASWGFERKFNARVARAERAGRRVILCEPQGYMNSSGETLGPLARFFNIPPSAMVVVVDDADLPLGELRLKPGGSSGGHHGLESIEQHLGTRDYARLRIGIGRSTGAREITGYVLGRFQSTELKLVDRVIKLAAEQAECWLEAGIQKAMNQFNGVIKDPGDEGKTQ